MILSANLDGTAPQGLVALERGAQPSGVAVARRSGDVEGDNDVDLDDFSAFPACMGGPAAALASASCGALDFDGQGHVDLADFVGFQVTFSTP